MLPNKVLYIVLKLISKINFMIQMRSVNSHTTSSENLKQHFQYSRIGVSIVLLINMQACAVVNIHGGKVSTTYYPGLAVVNVYENPDSPTVVSTNGLGLVFSAKSATLGWIQESLATIPDASKCWIIFIDTNSENSVKAITELNKLGINFESVCQINRGVFK